MQTNSLRRGYLCRSVQYTFGSEIVQGVLFRSLKGVLGSMVVAAWVVCSRCYEEFSEVFRRPWTGKCSRCGSEASISREAYIADLKEAAKRMSNESPIWGAWPPPLPCPGSPAARTPIHPQSWEERTVTPQSPTPPSVSRRRRQNCGGWAIQSDNVCVSCLEH